MISLRLGDDAPLTNCEETMSFTQASFGPISWVMNSELFSVDARSAAVGLASIVNFGASLEDTTPQ